MEDWKRQDEEAKNAIYAGEGTGLGSGYRREHREKLAAKDMEEMKKRELEMKLNKMEDELDWK